MIRFITLIACCLGICLAATAQRQYSPEFYVGASGGMVGSRFSFTPEVRQKMYQPGMTFGVRARYIEEKIFGLVAELNVTQRGWAEDFAYYGAPQFNYSRTLTYLQVPLLTHIYFGSERVKGFFNLGPEVGVMVGDKVSANFDYKNWGDVPGYPTGYKNNTQMDKAVENRVDYGISASAGMEVYANRKNSLTLEARYYFGIGNVFRDSKRDPFAASRAMSLAVTLGYYFRVL